MVVILMMTADDCRQRLTSDHRRGRDAQVRAAPPTWRGLRRPATAAGMPTAITPTMWWCPPADADDPGRSNAGYHKVTVKVTNVAEDGEGHLDRRPRPASPERECLDTDSTCWIVQTATTDRQRDRWRHKTVNYQGRNNVEYDSDRRHLAVVQREYPHHKAPTRKTIPDTYTVTTEDGGKKRLRDQGLLHRRQSGREESASLTVRLPGAGVPDKQRGCPSSTQATRH